MWPNHHCQSVLVCEVRQYAALVSHSSSSRMHVINHNWSATKQRLHPQSVAEISRYSVFRGQDSTMWDIVWVSPQGHRSVSVSRHFLLQAPQCPCSVRKRFSEDHCCRRRSKPTQVETNALKTNKACLKMNRSRTGSQWPSSEMSQHWHDNLMTCPSNDMSV